MKRWKGLHKTLFRSKEPAAPSFNGPGAPYHQSYIHRQPGRDGGANQWAWNTLALPTFPPAGLGCPNGLDDPALPGEQVIRAGQIVPFPNPPANVIQGAVLYMLGDPGFSAGQFVLQPLTDTSPAHGFAPDYGTGSEEPGMGVAA